MEKKKQLADLSAQMSKQAVTEVSKYADTLYNKLVVDVPKAILPEKIFVEYFLDFFRNGGNDSADSPLTLKWIEYAGGPYNEVSIVDSKGNVIYDVPSLYARPDVGDALTDVSLEKIASTYTLKANRLYNDGVKYLDNQISGISDVVKTENHHSNRWKNIFNRYKQNTIIMDTPNKPKTTVQNNLLEYLDYD